MIKHAIEIVRANNDSNRQHDDYRVLIYRLGPHGQLSMESGLLYERLQSAAGELVVSHGADQNRPHFRPHISATPRDQADMSQRVFLKSNDLHDETDMRQPIESFF